MYLFSWGKVPGNDSDKLQKFLIERLGVGWVENVDISKTDNGKTIIVSAGENSVELSLNEKRDKVNIKINNDRTYELHVKEENGELNIYNPFNDFQSLYRQIIGK